MGKLASAPSVHPVTQGFRCGRPAGVSGVGGQLGFQVWAPSLIIWVRATRLQVKTGAAYPEFTVQGLRGEGRQRPGLLRRVLYLAPECLYFLFLFEKFFLFNPPGPSKHLAAHTAQPGSLPRILQQTLHPGQGFRLELGQLIWNSQSRG